MIVKKHESGNQYIRAGDVWIRDFTKTGIAPIQLSRLFRQDDYDLVLQNESQNKNYPKISNEKISFKKAVIVSDGYKFEERHLWLKDAGTDVAIIAVNGALKKWKLFAPNLPKEERKAINAYVANNPYSECLSFLPSKESKYYPACVCSTRTSREFTTRYKGDIYTYCPTPNIDFGLESKEKYFIDDYRNPVCAAIGLCYRFNVERLLLLCCDDSFDKKRDFSVKLDNGLWTYPPIIKSHDIIDANLYWLTHQEDKEIEVADYSSGPKYLNARYIGDDEGALNFLHKERTSDA